MEDRENETDERDLICRVERHGWCKPSDLRDQSPPIFVSAAWIHRSLNARSQTSTHTSLQRKYESTLFCFVLNQNQTDFPLSQIFWKNFVKTEINTIAINSTLDNLIQISNTNNDSHVERDIMKWSNRKKRKRKSKGSIETIIFFQRLTKACSLSCTILRRRLVQGTRSLRIGTCHSCGRPCFSPGRKGGSLHLQAKDNQPPRPRDIKDPVPASRATIYLPAHPLSSFLANSPPSLSPGVPILLLGRVHDDTRLRH